MARRLCAVAAAADRLITSGAHHARRPLVRPSAPHRRRHCSSSRTMDLAHPRFCMFSLSAGSSTLGRHSLTRKLQLIAARGFPAVELMQDDLDAFTDSDEFSAIYQHATAHTPPLSPAAAAADPPTAAAVYNAFGTCTPHKLHREVSAAAYIGLLATHLGLQIASLQPLRDFEGWAPARPQHALALARAASRFEVMHALGTDMLFICSNCQPADVLVAQGEAYRHAAAADLRALAEIAARWEPAHASRLWAQRGLHDPIKLMARAWSEDGLRSPFLTSSALPLSPPDSRASSFSLDLEQIPHAASDDRIHLVASALAQHARRGPAPAPSSTQRRPIRIGYEALSWGTHVDTWRAAWDIVHAAAHPHVGLVLDSFNTIAREWADPCSPTGIAQPEAAAHARLAHSLADLVRTFSVRDHADKIFFLQIADARRVREPLRPSPRPGEPRPARMIWSRANRLFPLEHDRGAFLPVVDFVRAVVGEHVRYRGPWSVEIFSDSIHDEEYAVPAEHVERGYRSLERLLAAVRATA